MGWMRHLEKGGTTSSAPVGDPSDTVVALSGRARELIDKYTRRVPQSDQAWVHESDVPTSDEVGNTKDGVSLGPEVEIAANREIGSWDSKDEYLETHFHLLRQDTLGPLRAAVEELRAAPFMTEKGSEENANIYESVRRSSADACRAIANIVEVFIVGLTVAAKGFALKVDFSTRRAEKLLRWKQSKRLKTGSMVALSPKQDAFKTKCIVAIVASRQLGEVDVQYPQRPSIHLYLGDPSQIEIDPQQEFLMVEASNEYWEGVRYTLRALQWLSHDE